MYQGKKILAIVPARGGSKGVPLKNIQTVGGEPLVAITGKIIKELDMIDRAVVSTDHPEIARIAQEAGIDAPFMRPDDLSGDIVADWDVIDHALRFMEDLDKTRYDIILLLQPTCPMRRPEHVSRCVEQLVNGGYDAVWSVSETDSKAHPLKQLTFDGDKLGYYDEAGSKIIARQQLKPVYHRNGAAYALTRECILEKGDIKGDRTSAVVINEPLVSIDTVFDFQFCEFVLGLEK